MALRRHLAQSQFPDPLKLANGKIHKANNLGLKARSLAFTASISAFWAERRPAKPASPASERRVLDAMGIAAAVQPASRTCVRLISTTMLFIG
jgi:hypothetical protein